MQPRVDLPTVDDETAHWWDAARAGQLLIRRCDDCGRPHFYPRPFCPWCWSENVHWVQASGQATLYTYSVVRRNDLHPFNDRVPYVAAIVDLAEGPRMMTNVVDCDPSDVHIGMPLEVKFHRETDDIALAMFRPAIKTATA